MSGRGKDTLGGHIPTSTEFPSADVSSPDTISVLPEYLEVSATSGAPWIVYDPVALGLRMLNDGGEETAISIDLETSESWTLEVTFRPDQLPPDLSNLDICRFFVGAYDMQGPGCGLAISRVGLAIMPAPVGASFPIPGSQSLIPEGSDYYTIRIAVSAELDVTNIYITKTSLIPIKGHQLRFTTNAIQSPLDSSDGVIIDPLGTGSIPVQITLQTVRFNGHEMLIPNQRPVAVPGKDQGVTVGATVRFDGSGSYDPEGSALTYFWSLIDAPDGSQFKITGTDGGTSPDFNNDGFTYFFDDPDVGGPSNTGVFSADNAPVLQPGDTLVLGGQQYTVAVGVEDQTPMWVFDTITSKWVRNTLGGGWIDTRIAITAELLPDNLSKQPWTIYHSATFFDDQTHSIPEAIPDRAGLYEPQLVVNDGELDSIPEFPLLNVAQTSLTTGVIPDVSFIWNNLSDFWNLLEDKDKIETVWSGFAQAAANVLMTAWQIDYNKSLKDIQRVFQKRWLEYSLLLADDPTTASIRIVRHVIGTDDVEFGLPVGGKTLELLFDGGRAETITFVGDPLVNVPADEIAAQINARVGFELASVGDFPQLDYTQIQLDYPTLFQISPHGTANSLFRFSTTEYTQNELRGAGVEYSSVEATEFTTPGLSWTIKSGAVLCSPGPYYGLSGTTLEVEVIDELSGEQTSGSVTFSETDPISAAQAAAEIMASIPFIIASDDGTGRLWFRNTFVQTYTTMLPTGDAISVLGPDGWYFEDSRWFYGLDLTSLGISDQDMLVHKGIGYNIKRVVHTNLTPYYDAQLLLAEHMSWVQWNSLEGGWRVPWQIPSTVTSSVNNFTEELVAVGDLASFNVEYIPTGESVEVLCNILGVSQNRIGFDPVPLLAKYGGHVNQYNTGFVGVRRLTNIPIDPLIVEIPQLQEIIKDPTSFFTQNKDFLIQEVVSSKHNYDVYYPWPGPVYPGPVSAIPKESTRHAITFAQPKYALLDPPPDILWAEISYLDNQPAIEANFGSLVSFSLSEAASISDSLDYLSAVRGLWYAYFGGPSIENVRIGTQILLGLPFAEEVGIVSRIDPHFSATQGRIFLQDVSNPAIVRGYFYPTVGNLGLASKAEAVGSYVGKQITLSTAPVVEWASGDKITGQTSKATASVASKVSNLVYQIDPISGTFALGEVIGVTGAPFKLAAQDNIHPTFSDVTIKNDPTLIDLGDKIFQFAPLSSGVEVLDWVQGAKWGIPYSAEFSEVEKFFRFGVRVNVDAFDLANFEFVQKFVRTIKPHYTYPTFIALKNIIPDTIDVADELKTIVRKLIVSTPDTHNTDGYRYDDDVAGEAFNPPHDDLNTDGVCTQKYDVASADSEYTGSMTKARLGAVAIHLPGPGSDIIFVGGEGTPDFPTEIESYNQISGSFSTIGNLLRGYGRVWHTATLLHTYKILTVGGVSGSVTDLEKAELFDLATGVSEFTDSLPEPRSKHTATLLQNGDVLVSGGFSGLDSSALATALIFHTASGTFTTTGSMNVARFNHTATLLPDGTVLITGGYNNVDILASSEIFDPATGEFTLVGSMTEARWLHAAILLKDNRSVLIVCGENETGILASAELYDIASRSCDTTTNSTSVGRRWPQLAMLKNGRVVVCSGENVTVYPSQLTAIDVFYPAGSYFVQAGNTQIGRVNPAVSILRDGDVLIAGGSSAYGRESTAEVCQIRDYPFVFDRPILFPRTLMSVLASEQLSGTPKLDSIWTFDNRAGDILPLSGPAPTPLPYGPLVGLLQFDMGQEGGPAGLPAGVYSREWYL